MDHSIHGRTCRPDDRQFKELSSRNDPRALEIVWPYRHRLILSLRQKFGAYICYEDCEDLAEAAIIEAYQRGAAFDPAKATLATWLNTLAHYHALQFLRAHNCEYLPLEERAELSGPDLIIAEETAREVPSEEMQLALEQLPRSWARAIQLFYYEGLSTALIAHEMRIAESTVRCYLARGIARLSSIYTIARAESDE